MRKRPVQSRRRPAGHRHANEQRLWAMGVVLTAFLFCIPFLSRAFPRETIPTADTSAVVHEPFSGSAAASRKPEPEPQPIVQTVRFSATGDNLIHAPIYNQAKRRAADGEAYRFDYCYEHIAPLYAQQDVNWLNQETLCTDELGPSTYPSFSTPGDCARALYRAGVRVFSLSNNHTYDKGASGIAATLRFWDSMPEDVVTTGLWKGKSDYGRIYTNQTDVIEQQVKAARQLADFVVVGVHWGVENSHAIVKSQRVLAQSLADWGADLIVGTHPHVLQDAQWLTAADGRQVFTAYSLGNFISTQEKPDQLIGAILTVQLKKTTQPDGSVQRAVLTPQLLPTVTHYDAGKANVRTYLFRDYTQELAQNHGVRAKYSDFSLDTIQKIAQNNISSEFLQLT